MSIKLDSARLAPTTTLPAATGGAAAAPADAQTGTGASDQGGSDSRGFIGDIARWTSDHIGTIGAVLGTASLIAAIPLAHSPAAAAQVGAAAGTTLRSRIAARIASTSLGSAGLDAARTGAAAVSASVRSTSTGASALDGIARGWTGLRSARQALGATPVGRMLLAAQQPLYYASAAVGVVNLTRDVRDHIEGRGDWKRTALDALAVLPAASDVVKRFTNARAAATEARAATEVASALGEARERATKALVTAADELGAPAPVVSEIARAADSAGDVSHVASRTADAVATEARVVSTAPVAVPEAGTFVVRDLKHAVEAVEETTSHARSAVAAATPHTDVVEETLDAALRRTAHARHVLDDAASTSQRLTSTARGAERVQDVARSTSMTAGLAHNTAVLSSGNRDAASGSAQGIARTLLGRLLNANASAAPRPA